MVVRTLSLEFIKGLLLFEENRWKPESQLRKEKQQAPDENKGDQKRRNTFVDRTHRYLGYIFHHEDADGHRGDDHADHGDNADHDPEPQGRKAKLEDGGIKDRRGKNQKCQVINEGAPKFVNKTDENHNQVAVERQG